MSAEQFIHRQVGHFKKMSPSNNIQGYLRRTYGTVGGYKGDTRTDKSMMYCGRLDRQGSLVNTILYEEYKEKTISAKSFFSLKLCSGRGFQLMKIMY